MAINDAKPGRRPPASPWALAALLALAAGAAQLVDAGWRGSCRVDAGERAQMLVDLPPAADAWGEDQDGAWEAVLEAGGLRVRLRLTVIPDCD